MEMRRHPSPLARAVWFALKDCISQGRAPHLREVDAMVEEGTQLACDEMYDGLGLLNTIYTLAPLLGLMGTILGMMKAFSNFGMQERKSIELLSVGIEEALVTTLWGLSIAVLAFIASQWFQSKIRIYERFDLGAAAREVIVLLYGPTPEAEPGEAPRDFLSNQPPAAGEARP
jgi:biopolymer transport protein ExbB/TolQ